MRLLSRGRINSLASPLVATDLLDNNVQGTSVVVVKDEAAAHTCASVGAIRAVGVVGGRAGREGRENATDAALAVRTIRLRLYSAVPHGLVCEAVLAGEVPLLVMSCRDNLEGKSYLWD